MDKQIVKRTLCLFSVLLALALLPKHALAAELPRDVDASLWSAPYIAAALNDATMTAREDSSFAPTGAATYADATAALGVLTGDAVTTDADDRPITRGELAELLYRAARDAGEGFTGMWAFPLRYTDTVPESQYEAVCWLTMKGVLNGFPDGRFAADAVLAREQLAAALCRFEEIQRGFAVNRVDYGKRENWAYYESVPSDKTADVFFVCPSVVVGGGPGSYLMSLSSADARAAFLGATNMEKGIYDADARFFAPYYRQITLPAYRLGAAETERYLRYAYQDVRCAFDYYMAHCNNGRPIILAGFSQGADMCLRLMKDAFSDPALQDQLIACYAIGWRLTAEETEQYPQVRAAQGEDDTGVIVSFNSEAEAVGDSLMIPRGVRTLAINPLNWKTDGTRADRSLNLGACFTDYDGQITKELPALTGAYLDDTRGALKVTDVTAEAYPARLFDEGIYHIYDYQFFYRNLQKNVETRMTAYRTHRDASKNLLPAVDFRNVSLAVAG